MLLPEDLERLPSRGATSEPWEERINTELFAEILSGRTTRERKLSACGGSSHLSSAERAEALAVLSEDADDLVRERAENAIVSQSIDGFVTALEGEAPAAQVFRYCLKNLIHHAEIATAIVLNTHCPAQILTTAAKQMPTSAVQELMENLDRLSASPGLVAALMHSASLTADQRQQLEELARNDTGSSEAFERVAKDAEPDPEKRMTLLQRISQMRVVERVQMALKGNREERMALIHDSCKVVQRAVLQSPRLTDLEVEGFAAMASLTDEILRLIGSNRKHRKNYTVMRNLMFNPKSPIDLTLRMLPNMNPGDLKNLGANKNIPETLRTSAARLLSQRNKRSDG